MKDLKDRVLDFNNHWDDAKISNRVWNMFWRSVLTKTWNNVISDLIHREIRNG